MRDDDLAYLVALHRFNRSWRLRRWLHPHRVLLWAVRRRWRSPQTTVEFSGITYSRSAGGAFYPDARKIRAALRQGKVKQARLLFVCWLRGHNMPIQDCLRCRSIIM